MAFQNVAVRMGKSRERQWRGCAPCDGAFSTGKMLNHLNFNDPATGTGSSLGRITGAMDPRIGQLSLKLFF
jgi:hypothetical protein